MTEIFFIRHAQSDFTWKDELTRPLTEQGLRDAKQLPQLFNQKRIDAIYCSPYKRSIQTLTPLANHIQQPIQIDEDLRERSIGKWVENFHAYSQQQWTDFTFKLEHGESLAEVQSRNIRAIHAMLERHPEQTIVVGTHGTALSTILNHYDPAFRYQKFLEIVDLMPYLMQLTFHQTTYLSREEMVFPPPQ